MKRNREFKVGDSVVVKPHVKDSEFDIDLSGWQGRILEVFQDDNVLCIEWDSMTLKKMPNTYITTCEENGDGWDQYYIEGSEVEFTNARDTATDVNETYANLQAQHYWDHLGQEGQRIQHILADIHPENDVAAFKAWEQYFQNLLQMPFQAKVFEFQERGPLKVGVRVEVQHIVGIEDPYGILVEVTYQRKHYHFPLCDLEVVDKDSPNYQPLRDYAVWFANH